MKRALCLLLIAITLCTTLSVPAFAATPSGQETTVSYTVDTWYTVNIPESIDATSYPSVEITASSMLESGKHLYVRVDSDRSLVDGDLLLYKDGDINASTLKCSLRICSSSATEYFSLEETSFTVAVFECANAKAIEYGCIKFQTVLPANQEFGTYYGTLYFTFSVE